MILFIDFKRPTFKFNSSSKFFIVFFVFLANLELNSAAKERVYHLNETDLDQISILNSKVIICKAAEEKKWFKLWARSYLDIDDVTAVDKVYAGHDLNTVKSEMSKWLNVNYFLFLTNSSTINLKLYSDCMYFL